MTETTIEPFLRNAWYLGAWSDEVADGGVLARTIMSQPLVFFRGPDGKAAALEDRCCHRSAPLTHGNVVETGIECGYHGLIFGCRQTAFCARNRYRWMISWATVSPRPMAKPLAAL